MIWTNPQRGAAILAAMVTVTLVATVAAGAIARQSSAVQVEAAERSRVQALWLLRGALDWSRLLLRQDAQSSRAVDHLAEPWALPLQETKLAAFLAVHAGAVAADASANMSQAYLSGNMQDAQSKLNLVHFLAPTAENTRRTDQRPVQRLFERLGLPQSEYLLLEQALWRAFDEQGGDAQPIRPQTLQDLAWLGVAASTIEALQPYAMLHPTISSVNINTASAHVIWALVPEMDWSQAQALVAARTHKHFANLQQAQDSVADVILPTGVFSLNSQLFSVHGQVRMEGIVLGMQADLARTQAIVTTDSVRIAGVALPAGRP